MDDQLLSLLEYDGVLSVLAATPDGLVVAAAGLNGDDAEIVGAAGSILFGSIEEPVKSSGSIQVGSGAVHLFCGDEVSLVVLTEASVSHERLSSVVGEPLESAGGMFV